MFKNKDKNKDKNKEYVNIDIDISDELFLKIAELAHDCDITINHMFNRILKCYIDDK